MGYAINESISLIPDSGMFINGVYVVFPRGAEFFLEAANYEIDEEAAPAAKGGLCLTISEGGRMMIEGALLTFRKKARVVLKVKCAFLHDAQMLSRTDARQSPLHLWYWRLQRAYAGVENLRPDYMEEFRYTILPSDFDPARRAEITAMAESGQFHPTLKEIAKEAIAWVELQEATSEMGGVAD